MIDAQAILTQLEAMGTLALDGSDEDSVDATGWLESGLEQTTLEHHRSAAGDYWITFHGNSERAVVLGTYQEPAFGPLSHRFPVLVGLEVLKAIKRRGEERPSCTLKLVIWAASAEWATPSHLSAALLEEHAAAYLELHVEPAKGVEREQEPLGVVTANEAGELITFNPRLVALCDEAILELTGKSAVLRSGSVAQAAGVAHAGLAAAVMSVHAPQATSGLHALDDKPLHLLQAAEAFGRWVESTMHLVAGESVDLWAQEHRIPHNE